MYFIFANGNIRKVPRCNVQLCDNGVEIEKGKEGKNEAKVQFEEQGFGNDIENKDVEVNKRVTRSMTDAKREEKKYQHFGCKWKIQKVLMK